jgi:exoribonuclease R
MNPSIKAGFQAIRAANNVPDDDAGDDALRALATTVEIDQTVVRRDALDLAFVTLDPAASTDLDQAFAVHRDGDQIVLHYAIADIGAFVIRGGALEAQAWERGVTVYAPDGSVPLYPRVLSSQRASLLPDGPRPAVLLTVQIDPAGIATLKLAERAWVRSRAKLAYESVSVSDLSADTHELAARIARAERARGAFRMDRPEQQVITDAALPGGIGLRFAPRLASEDQNAALSLAANLAVGDYLLKSGLGLFRVMDAPGEVEVMRLRQLARSLQIEWQHSEGLNQVVGRLDASIWRHAAFALAIRKCGGGARYMEWPASSQERNANQMLRPWHAAIAATYAHATAPMRRLADRYVLDLLVAQFAHDQVGVANVRSVLHTLPELMERAEQRAAKVERNSMELIESTLLEPLVGQQLSARVLEVSRDGVQVQIDDPAVLWRLSHRADSNTQVGDTITVTVVQAENTTKAASNSKRLGYVRSIDLQRI